MRHASPRTLFIAFVVLHVAVWTLLPVLGATNLPLDVVEALAWGREWQAGYYKHPPLSAWAAETARLGTAHWPLFLLSQIFVAIAFVAAWMLARDILTPWRALVSVAALEGVHYHTITSIEFNANVVQYPFWGIAGLAFWRAVRQGGLAWWIVLGVACAAGILGKHSFALLPAAMGVFMLLHPDGRRALATPGPWLALVLCAALLVPHLLWNLEHGFPSVTYAAERGAAGERSIGDVLVNIAGFLGAQMLALIPLLILILLAGRPALQFTRPTRDGWLLITIGLGPLIGYIAAALFLGIGLRDMWGAPLFLLSGPLLMVFLDPKPLMLRRFAIGFAAFLSLGAIGYAGATLIGPRITGQWERVHFSGRELASEVGSAWRERFDTPLTVVVGDAWVAGNVSFYDLAKPSVYIDANPASAPWLDDAIVRERGAVVAWMSDKRGTRELPLADSPLATLEQRFPAIEAMPPFTVRARWLGGSAPVTINWAIIPPRGVEAERAPRARSGAGGNPG
jgi:4-amino-4-deoxy-L-arabinose transferase-like glycosyltransferase